MKRNNYVWFGILLVLAFMTIGADCWKNPVGWISAGNNGLVANRTNKTLSFYIDDRFITCLPVGWSEPLSLGEGCYYVKIIWEKEKGPNSVYDEFWFEVDGEPNEVEFEKGHYGFVIGPGAKIEG